MATWSAYARTAVLSGGLLLAGMGLIPISATSPTPAQAVEPKERHPHIHRAITELKEARKELEKADNDFGGHRKEAIEAVDVAIRHLERALKFDKN